MSAFIVTPETIDRVLTLIEQTDRGNRELLEAFGLDPHTFTAPDLDSLGNELYALNRDAVWQRYPNDPTPDDLPGPIDSPLGTYRYRQLQAFSKIDGFKALQCLLYQCYEGDVPSRGQFKALERFSYIVAQQIIGELPEYQAAAWD